MRQVLDDGTFLGVRSFKEAEGVGVVLTLPASPRVRTE
jgi:hypothetical protein